MQTGKKRQTADPGGNCIQAHRDAIPGIMKRKEGDVNVFGVRHLSPAAGYHLNRFLDRIKPRAILIEGPSDASSWLKHLADSSSKPPFAILAYTTTLPVKSVIYPLASYSPEYSAALWGYKNGAFVEFIDLPSSAFLGLELQKEEELLNTQDKEKAESADPANDSAKDLKEFGAQFNLYESWAKAAGYRDYDTYWEANFEHNLNEESYHMAAYEFGLSIREFRKADGYNLMRESYMRRAVNEVIKKGYQPEEVVVVTGAYHAPVISIFLPAMTDNELKKLPAPPSKITLMPYSYLRISSRGGYGAGNTSPKYYEMMWEAMNKGSLQKLPQDFLVEVARDLRENGTFKSTAEVIEAVRLAEGLAYMSGQSAPTLSDLRSAALTCLAQGEISIISEALARVEVGTSMGHLAEDVSRTAIQDDFYNQLKDLKLEKYKTMVSETLILDLRENRNAKSESARYLDLNRSFFLHRLDVMKNPFARSVHSGQQSATWKEVWSIAWSTEAEIELVESSLMGESVEMVAAYKLKGMLDDGRISSITSVIELSAKCGMPGMLDTARAALQSTAVDTDSFEELAHAAGELSSTIFFGDIRRTDTSGLMPLLTQLFYKGVLVFEDNCSCDMKASKTVAEYMDVFDKIARQYPENVDVEGWQRVLRNVANRDDLSPYLSGYACALLLEKGLVDADYLSIMVSRRLSPGIPADLGAGWFEGIAGRNRYSLINNIDIWHLLNDYVTLLDNEEFTRALVFLRRAFTDFSIEEKRGICDNLANIWKVEGTETKLMAELSNEEKKVIESLDDFDFGDF